MTDNRDLKAENEYLKRCVIKPLIDAYINTKTPLVDDDMDFLKAFVYEIMVKNTKMFKKDAIETPEKDKTEIETPESPKWDRDISHCYGCEYVGKLELEPYRTNGDEMVLMLPKTKLTLPEKCLNGCIKKE